MPTESREKWSKLSSEQLNDDSFMREKIKTVAIASECPQIRIRREKSVLITVKQRQLHV